MPTLRYTLSSKVHNGMAEVLVRFYSGTSFSQRAKSRIFVPADKWNAKAEGMDIPRRVTPDTVALLEYNQRLDALRNAIYELWWREQYSAGDGWLQSAIDDYMAIPKQMLRRRMSELVAEYAVFKKATGRMLDQYEVVQRAFEEYDTKHSILYADKFTPDAVGKFIDYYATRPRILKSGAVMQVQRCGNTLRAKERLIAAVCAWAVRKGYMERSPFGSAEYGLYEIKDEVYGKIVYLTPEERDTIYAYEYETERLNLVRDIFIFQCHVGCRVSDLLAFTSDNVSADGMLQYIPIKTRSTSRAEVTVPLTDVAKAIIRKYAPQPDGRLLPFVNESEYNRRIHDIARIAGLRRVVVTLDRYTGEQQTKELWEVCTSHIARKTFSMLVFKKTRSEMVSAAFTGHSPNTRSFKRYAEVDDAMKLDIMREIENDTANN